MTLEETMKTLQEMGTELNRKVYARHGVTGDQFGVSFANMGKLVKQIKMDHELALQLFQAQFIASVRDLNLTPRQLSLLFILSQVPEITQVGFARLFGLDPSTCAVVMRNLARRGLLDSAPSPEDRRARTYRITEAGRRIGEEAGPRVDLSEDLVFRDAPGARRTLHLLPQHMHLFDADGGSAL